MFKKALGHIKETGFVGTVAGVDFMGGTITLANDAGALTVVKQDEVEILLEAFELHGYPVFDKDILGAVNGKLYQVELHNDGEVTLHNVNEKLEVVASGEKFEPVGTILSSLEAVMDLQGNLYELLNALPKNPEFNVKIVKHFDGTSFTYYYACNNKEVEQIDLIKVLYMGHRLLEEEDYERNTISHEDYMKRVADGNLTEVSPQELHNFVTGATYNHKTTDLVELADEIESEMSEEVVEDFCCDVEVDSDEEENPWE